jgi:hypothetical protein
MPPSDRDPRDRLRESVRVLESGLSQPFPFKWIGLGLLIFALLVVASASTYVIEPGTRGIKVTLGKAEPGFLSEGFGVKVPFITSIVAVSVRQRTQSVQAACFSSDLQQVMLDLRVLYRVPDKSVVEIYKQYAGDPFDSLIAPRVQEALKEVTAMLTAEKVVKSRESIKAKALAAARLKIGHSLGGGHRDPRHPSLQRARARDRGQDGRRATGGAGALHPGADAGRGGDGSDQRAWRGGRDQGPRRSAASEPGLPAPQAGGALERQVAARRAGRTEQCWRGAAPARGELGAYAPMSPRMRAFVAMVALVAALVVLILLFPRAAAFGELAARELRYFWWLILIVALAVWLIWGVGRRPRR